MKLELKFNHPSRVAYHPYKGPRNQNQRVETRLDAALCHPEQKHEGQGLCRPCYKRIGRVLYNVFCPQEEKAKWRFVRHLAKRKLSFSEYEKMWETQNGACKICRQPGDQTKPKRLQLALDHCHKKGHARALLCWHCNNLIGYLENLRAPIDDYFQYLKENQESVDRSGYYSQYILDAALSP